MADLPLRVVLIGQQAFGVDVLKALQDEKCTSWVRVVGVSAPAPQKDGPSDPLWTAACAAATADSSIVVVDTARISEPDLLTTWTNTSADIAVMAFVTHILPDSVLAACRYGAIQYHPSLLPLHRGRSAINWAIINGDTTTGLSIFWVDKQIDHGPILHSVEVPISPDDTVKTLYFQKLYPEGVAAVMAGLRMVYDGRQADGTCSAPRIEQRHCDATYEPPCSRALTRIAWHAPARQLYALIRGADPSPGAWTEFKGEVVSFYDSKLDTRPATAAAKWTGTVLNVGSDSFTVRLNGGNLIVSRVAGADGKKVAANAWAAAVDLKAGDRFK